MEIIIAVLLGVFLSSIGVIGYVRICKDFEKGNFDNGDKLCRRHSF